MSRKNAKKGVCNFGFRFQCSGVRIMAASCLLLALASDARFGEQSAASNEKPYVRLQGLQAAET